MDIKVEVEQNRYLFTYIMQTQYWDLGCNTLLYSTKCMEAYV